MQTNSSIYLAKNRSDYKRLNLKEGVVEEWEDGFRTRGEKGTLEWWYFDVRTEEGSTIVIVFYTKKMTEINAGLSPLVTVNILRKDGTRIFKELKQDKKSFFASKETCNVKIGKNYIKGNLQEYEIHMEDKELKLDMKVKALAKSWRPGTGYQYFGNKKNYFAWLVAIPKGRAEIKYTYKKTTKTISGFCYHDHNWGNASLAKLIRHWCWIRANIGPYTLISSEIVATKKYNNEIAKTFYISKNGKMLTDKEENTKLYKTHSHIDKITNKPVSENVLLVYEKNNKARSFQILFIREGYVSIGRFVKGKIKRWLIRLITGFDGAYLRMFGTTRLRSYRNGAVAEEYISEDAIWDFIYFGNSGN